MEKMEGKVRIESKNMNELVKSEFGGNMSKCAEELGVSRSTICRVMNGRNNAGLKLVSRVVEYCNNNNLKLSKYLSNN